MRDEILKFNEDILQLVYASAHYGINKLGKYNIDKQLSFLAMADVHADVERYEDALLYLNEIGSLDFGISLGDAQRYAYSDNDGSWFTGPILNSEKPFYPVMGNHDGGNVLPSVSCGTREQIFDKFIRPIREKIGLPYDLDKTYYSVNFDEYKVTMIVLDNYIQPEDRDENGEFVYKRGIETISPDQLDWLIETLNEIPEGYHVMIARHGFPEPNVVKESTWSLPGMDAIAANRLGYGSQDIITHVVDAWINGKALNKEIHPSDEFNGLPVLNINADFSKRGEGVFIGYFTGHVHRDLIAVSKTYPNQNIFSFASAACDNYISGYGDLPRVRGTKLQDCLTVCSIDTEKRLLKLVRVGSNITVDLTERKYLVVKY